MSGQDQQHGQQLSGNQKPEQLYETQAQQSKLIKNEQEGTRSYETNLRQTKISKNKDEGTHAFETQTFQTKLQTKGDQENQQNAPLSQEVKSDVKPSQGLSSSHEQPHETQHAQGMLQYPHNRQESLELPSKQEQPIHSHEHPIHSHEHPIHSHENLINLREQPIHSHEQPIQSNEHKPQVSELYGRQSPEKQPAQQQVFAQRIQHIPEEAPQQQGAMQTHLDTAQSHLKTAETSVQQSVKQAQESVQKAQQAQQALQEAQQAQQAVSQAVQQPQTSVVYEVYRAKLNPNDVQFQGNQNQEVQGIQKQGTELQGSQLPAMNLFQGINPQTNQSGIQNLATSNSWVQPLPDAQGTMIAKPNYDKEEARRDAMSLLKAMRGAGTDTNTIVDISGNRTFAQRQMIVQEYALLDGTQKKDLLQDLKSEAGADLESLLLPLYMIPGEFDARLMEKAMYGIRNDVEVLIEVLCTRTNKELEDMKNAWREKIDPKVRLEEKVGDETKTLFGATNFHDLCLKLLQANRPPCSKPDPNQVHVDAEDLYHHLLERKDVSTAKSKFIEIFTERSWAHIGAVVGEFQKISEKLTIEAAISQQFGGSNNTSKAFQVMAEFCAQPYDFWASRLLDAMKGLGTSDNKLVRIIVSRCEVDMNNIVLVFGQRYGDGKNLKNWIDSETSGPYAQLLSNLCGFH